MMFTNRFSILPLAFLLSLSLALSSSAGTITFDDGVIGANDFENGVSAFDNNGGVGSSATDADPANSAWAVTMTTVDVFAPEYEDDGTGTFVLTGNTLFASAGDGVVTNIVGTEQPGVNNPSISNAQFGTTGGSTSQSESAQMNPGEGWIFEFGSDVTLDFIDMSSTAAGAILDISVNGTLLATFDYTTDSEQQTDPLGGLVLLAGDDVTFAVRGPIETTDIRVETIQVTKVVPEPAVPGLLLAFAGLFAVRYRKRVV